MGAIYANNNDHRKGIKYRRQAIEILRQTKDSITLAAALMNTGYGYYLIEKYDSALYLYEESGEIYSKKNFEIGKAYNLGNAGLVYAKQGKTLEAEEQLTEAIEILKELEDSYAITEFEIEMANIYEQRGEKQKAEKYLLGALAYAQEDGLKERIRDASLQLSELYSSEQEFEKAYEYLQNYLVYRDSINNEETIRKMADLRTEFEVGQKQAEVDLLEEEAFAHRVLLWSGALIGGLLLGVIVLLHRFYLMKVRTARIAKARRQVIQGQRDELDHLNATKDRFFSIISHDLRGPVSNFNGVTYLIQRSIEEGDQEELKSMGIMLEESAQDLSSLLDNLLDWAMSQQGTFPYKPQSINIAEICNPALRVFKNTAKAKSIEIDDHVTSDLQVYVDVNSTSTIIRNLLNNALKFTAEGGSVSLNIEMQEKFAVIHVSDTGIGIPQDKLERLFVFKGVKTSYGTQGEKGVGLGLNLVKEFVDLNKGKIKVESEEGKGSRFSVFLPLAKS
ncbi:tetratricopeptide repeat-containing sensor histidine kinase [Reichenbachiella ulvae]|uniref:histidine kinase n=1 Tax=Reichenbachiella ulvae TaxID=2980104 RepID=A0ABT3CYT4_9BACT|nr:ATP-binding protein [Reichenbachiella ulvae]MCV9388719.1 ATP-binding protein [Reichenbachiella ulvae]